MRTAASKAMWVGRRAVLLLTVTTVALVTVASPAWANTFRVNSMGDAADNSSTDGECATDPFPVGTEPNCTLRAAIQESNVNAQGDTIVFDPALAGTITLSLGQLTIANDATGADLSIQGPGARKITVSGNDASQVFAIQSSANATISGLTVSDGRADNVGFFDNNGGGGISNDGGTLTLTNSTVSGNTADEFGGGLRNTGGTLTLTNSTVSGNTVNDVFSGFAAGILNDGGGTLRLTNTIVARNTATTNPDASATFNSQGNNFFGDTTGATGFVASDLLNMDPLLGPLQNNGGPTNTHALLPGSPAVDAGTNSACLLTDQRGEVRQDGDANGTVICDIGAFEKALPPNAAPVARNNSYGVKEDKVLRVGPPAYSPTTRTQTATGLAQGG